MGTYRQGVLGAFSGKVGTVIGSRWKGIDYMRGLGRPSSRQPTEAQLQQRVKFGLAIKFLKPFSDLLTIGYKGNRENKTGVNIALAKLLDPAFGGTFLGNYPDYIIGYNQVQLADGPLELSPIQTVTSTVAGKFTFTWSTAPVGSLAQPTDKLIVAVHHPGTSTYLYSMNAATRQAGECTYTCGLSGQDVHIWFAFISADGKYVSKSSYLGELTIH